jgi:integrase
MAYIQEYKDKNGKTISYQVKWRNNGKGNTETFKKKSDANKFKKQIEAELALGLVKDDKKIKFSDYADEFMKIHTDDLRANTIRNYYQTLEQLKKELDNVLLGDITPRMLDSYFLKLKNEKLIEFNSKKSNKKMKMSSLKKYRDVLNLILNDAFIKEIIPYNPLVKLAFKFKDDEYEDDKSKVISSDDLSKILNTFEVEYYKHLILIAIMTGFRKGEILALKWSDIDFEKKIIKVRHSLSKEGIGPTKTKSSKRDFPLHKNLETILEEISSYQLEMKRFFGKSYFKNNLIVCKPDGDFIKTNQVSSKMWEKSQTHGIHFTMHKLRHTFATWMRGLEVKDVQALLGHSKADITANIYQSHDEYKSESITKIEETLNSKLLNSNTAPKSHQIQ